MQNTIQKLVSYIAEIRGINYSLIVTTKGLCNGTYGYDYNERKGNLHYTLVYYLVG